MFVFTFARSLADVRSSGSLVVEFLNIVGALVDGKECREMRGLVASHFRLEDYVRSYQYDFEYVRPDVASMPPMRTTLFDHTPSHLSQRQKQQWTEHRSANSVENKFELAQVSGQTLRRLLDKIEKRGKFIPNSSV